MKKLRLIFLATAGLVLGHASIADAALIRSYQFNGRGNWSLDAVGSNNTPVGNVQALIPTGSKIEKAFLYSSTFNNTILQSIGFDGTTLNSSDFTALGVTGGGNGLQAYRADVTSLVANKVGGGGGLFNFLINFENPNRTIDGEALAIVYSNPSEAERTIAFLDGFSDPMGDSFTVNLADPLDLTKPGFDAQLSLGIGFGFQPSGQFSTVDVNGQRLTSSAGGQDDGIGENGGLITIGGLGDDPGNPPPFATDAGGPRVDDELYTLTPFLSQGDTTIIVNTRNPSNDDNIFFAGVNITAIAGVDQPPPAEAIPTPALLPGLIGMGVAALRKRGQEEGESAEA